MPEAESTGNKIRTTRTHEAQERSRSNQSHESGVYDGQKGMQALPDGLLGRDSSQSTFERHAALIGDRLLSLPANASARFQIVRGLQHGFGNQYVQRLVKHSMRPRVKAAERDTQASDAPINGLVHRQLGAETHPIIPNELRSSVDVRSLSNDELHDRHQLILHTLSQFNQSTEETVLLEEQERRAGIEVEIRGEWDAHPGIHSHFRQPELESYRQLRPLYRARGIQNPAEYLDNNIVQVTFFGNSTPAHSDMSAPLQAAENALSGQGINPVILNFWAFVPRLTASGNLSNHAEGRAVDINRQDNPHIINQRDIRVIRAVTGVDLGTQQGASVMRQASQTFQSTFNQQWVDQQTQQLQQQQAQANPSQAVQQEIQQLLQLIDSIDRRRQALNGYAQRGFFNLEQSLVDALVDAGLSWGGQWQHSKDFMHFEL